MSFFYSKRIRTNNAKKHKRYCLLYIIIINIECTIMYTDWLRKLDSLFHICPKDGTTKKNEMELVATLFFLFYDTYSLLNIEIQNFKLTVTLTIIVNIFNNCPEIVTIAGNIEFDVAI
jgi:hypothetical protein